MPTYDFKCSRCDTNLSIVRSITSKEKEEFNCPSCELPMTRVFAAPAVTFAGTGWGKDAR